MSQPGFTATAAVMAVLMMPAAIAAQTGAGDSAPRVTAGWRDGFFLQSDDGDYRLQLNGLFQTDERFVVDDTPHNVIDTFGMRRIRPILQGRIAKYFDFYLNPDFAGAVVNIRDAYLDTRLSPAFRIRVGKGKTPFGLERLQSASYLTFVERALPTAVAPDRDIGAQVLGDAAGGLVSYQAGVFNGVVDGGSTEVDANDSKDVAARLVVRPFIRVDRSPLAGMGLAFAGSSGIQPALLPSFRTSSQQTFFAYDRAATGDGRRNRFSPQYFYYYKSLATFGEYIRSRGTVTRAQTSRKIDHEAFMITGSLVITGETVSDRGVTPRHPFDPGRHTWGALQIAARYHALRIDPDAIALGFAVADSNREAKAFSLGANWYLNPYIKWVFNFERTVFGSERDVARRPENALLIRNQLNF